MKKPVCQFETIEDHFNFGRYNGLTLADVLEINPSYIEWCVKKCYGVYFPKKERIKRQKIAK